MARAREATVDDVRCRPCVVITVGGAVMIASDPTATSLRHPLQAGSRGIADPPGEGSAAVAILGAACWLDPGTERIYPTSYRAYRRTREAEEKPLPRHRTLGPDVDHYVWRRGMGSTGLEVEVLLTVRQDAPPRIRRIVAEILRAIRRGQPAGHAIRHVARRFGLRHTRAREFITACIGFEIRPRPGAMSPFAEAH
jgi:hypothetical protein